MVTIKLHSWALHYVRMVFEDGIIGSLSDKGQRAEQTLPQLRDPLWSHDPGTSSPQAPLTLPAG